MIDLFLLSLIFRVGFVCGTVIIRSFTLLVTVVEVLSCVFSLLGDGGFTVINYKLKTFKEIPHLIF